MNRAIRITSYRIPKPTAKLPEREPTRSARISPTAMASSVGNRKWAPRLAWLATRWLRSFRSPIADRHAEIGTGRSRDSRCHQHRKERAVATGDVNRRGPGRDSRTRRTSARRVAGGLMPSYVANRSVLVRRPNSRSSAMRSAAKRERQSLRTGGLKALIAMASKKSSMSLPGPAKIIGVSHGARQPRTLGQPVAAEPLPTSRPRRWRRSVRRSA